MESEDPEQEPEPTGRAEPVSSSCPWCILSSQALCPGSTIQGTDLTQERCGQLLLGQLPPGRYAPRMRPGQQELEAPPAGAEASSASCWLRPGQGSAEGPLLGVAGTAETDTGLHSRAVARGSERVSPLTPITFFEICFPCSRHSPCSTPSPHLCTFRHAADL